VAPARRRRRPADRRRLGGDEGGARKGPGRGGDGRPALVVGQGSGDDGFGVWRPAVSTPGGTRGRPRRHCGFAWRKCTRALRRRGGQVLGLASWPCMHARDARGRGVRRRVAGRGRDESADLHLGAAQGTWGRAERSRRCRSTAEPPRDSIPEEGRAARGDAAWVAPRSGARVRASVGQGASFNFV
jgi:hypothetical protein